MDRLILVSSAGLGPDVSLPLRILRFPSSTGFSSSRPCRSSPAFSIVSSSTPPRSPPILRGSTTRCFPARLRSGLHGDSANHRHAPGRTARDAGAHPGGARQDHRPHAHPLGAPGTASCPSARPSMPRGGFPGPACTSSSAAHMPNVEYPEEFNRIVLEFLDEGRGSRGEGRE
ncbi:MAG: hypothetical protein MZV70_12785 [Desulfobacterales bacterium]|nr:hypothetical protein [Desulfobacterales bacterium]